MREHAAMAHEDSMIACCRSLLFTVAAQTKYRGPTSLSVRQSVTQMRRRVCCSFYSLAFHLLFILAHVSPSFHLLFILAHVSTFP